MVTPYASMVDGVIHSEEKSMDGRVVKLEDTTALFTEVNRLIKTLDQKDHNEKVRCLKKILVYLTNEIGLQ
jgi:hypothetical protein